MPPDAPDSAPARGWLWEVAAAAVAVLGTAMRCTSWHQIFSAGEVILPDTDPYYHLWRAERLAESFPAIPTFDSFISFPTGAPIPWPPGFDLLLTIPNLAGCDGAGLAGWGALLIPLLGGLSVYLVYRLGRLAFGPACGLVAAILLALMEGSISFSFLGRVDHHALVAPVTLGMFLALLASLKAASRKRAMAFGILCGLLAAYSVGSWIITPPLYFLPVPLVLLAMRWGPDLTSARRAALFCLGSAVLLVVLTVLLVADLKARPFVLYQPSWFTVTLVAVMAAAVLLAFYSRRPLLAPAALVLLAVPLLWLVFPGWRRPVSEALGVMAGSDPSYRMAAESWSLLWHADWFTLQAAAWHYTYLFILAPFLLAAFIWRAFSKRPLDPGAALVGVFALLGFSLVVIQQRFGEYGAPALALLFAWALVAGYRTYFAFLRSAENRTRALVWGALLLLALGAALSPLVTSRVDAAGTDQVSYQRDLVAFGRELARSLPPAEGQDGTPSYGLLSGWNDAHPLLYSARRPVMTSSFGTPEALAGNRRAFRLLLSADEEESFGELARQRIRFVVVSSIIEQVEGMTEIAGLSEPMVVATTRSKAKGFLRVFRALLPFVECLHTRMFVGDGTIRTLKDHRYKPLAHFRLHLESHSGPKFFGQLLPRFKAFEVVAGARLSGRAQPGVLVQLKLPLRTNTARSFFYRREATADSEGRFEIVVPYPTEDPSSPTIALAPYQLKIGDLVVALRVSEQEVREGRLVQLK